MLSAIGVGTAGTLLGRMQKTSLIDLNKGIAFSIVATLGLVRLVHARPAS
jgi:hypothetical protein